MWIELASDRLAFAEYQPALVDEMARRHADRRIYALGLSADGSNDRLIPIEEIMFRPVQVPDLPLPTAVPVFQSVRKGQDTRR
jgi:hypothetical protein